MQLVQGHNARWHVPLREGPCPVEVVIIHFGNNLAHESPVIQLGNGIVSRMAHNSHRTSIMAVLMPLYLHSYLEKLAGLTDGIYAGDLPLLNWYFGGNWLFRLAPYQGEVSLLLR
jgi:hypothetical protein